MSDKTSDKRLRPCPFCGGEEISMGAYSISPDCYIECKSCSCMIEREVPWNGMNQEEHDRECAKILIEAWNTRKPMERIVERLSEAAFPHKIGSDVEMVMFKSRAIEIVKEETNAK